MAVNFEQFVINNEIARLIDRFLRGIQVNQDTLAFDVIQAVRPGGQLLDQAHTVRRFREEHLDRDILFQARRRVQEILTSHRPPELTPEAKAGIQAILARVSREPILY